MLVATVNHIERVQGQFGPKTVVVGTLAFDASYPTGGESLLNTQIGLTTIDQLQVLPTDGKSFFYDSSTSKVKVFTAASTEAANASDQSSLATVPFEAIGS